MGIHGRVTGSGAISGGNGPAAALAAIPLNNSNTRGTGMDGLLGSDLDLNPAQLVDVKYIVTKKQGIADRSPRGGGGGGLF